MYTVEEGTAFPRKLDQYFDTVTTCNKYVEIKLYQYMLYKIIETNDTGNVSNLTIISDMYLLQQAGELLQAIQVSFYINTFHYFTTNIHSMTIITITVQITMIK